MPTISAAFDLLVDPLVLPDELLPSFVDLLFLSFQLLNPYGGRVHCSPFGRATEVAHRGGLLPGDTFDVSLGGYRHEAFPGGMMAPPTGVRARVRPWAFRKEAME